MRKEDMKIWTAEDDVNHADRTSNAGLGKVNELASL
jgi:hypothetical protein